MQATSVTHINMLFVHTVPLNNPHQCLYKEAVPNFA